MEIIIQIILTQFFDLLYCVINKHIVLAFRMDKGVVRQTCA